MLSDSPIEQALRDCSIRSRVQELGTSTRTVADAAASLHCSESQIGKSIIFRSATDRPILVVASGTNRISEHRLATLVGEEVEKATASFVQRATGYAIGGVPPFAHLSILQTFLDSDLLNFDKIFVAAGSPRKVVELTPTQLTSLVPHAVITTVS